MCACVSASIEARIIGRSSTYTVCMYVPLSVNGSFVALLLESGSHGILIRVLHIMRVVSVIVMKCSAVPVAYMPIIKAGVFLLLSSLVGTPTTWKGPRATLGENQWL